jgi:hypothetical protein
MPYINDDCRSQVDEHIDKLVEHMRARGPEAAKGMLNYTICRLLCKVMKPLSGWRYAMMNDMMGVVSCVERELYRRVIAPYEDKKAKENDLDVFS